MAKRALPSWLRTAGFVLLAAILLAFAFKGVDLGEVWDAAKDANWAYIALSVSLGYFALLSRGKRWTLVLNHLGHKTPVWNAVHSIGIGYLVNMALPRAGEVARATALSNAQKTPLNVVLGTIIMERTIDLLLLLGLIGLTFMRASGELKELLALTQTESTDDQASGFPWGIALAVLLALGIFSAWLFRRRIQTSAIFLRFKAFLKGLMEGIRAVGQLPNQWVYWGHTLVIWICYYAMVYVCFFALPSTAHLNLSEGLFIMVAASLGIVIPVPGGIGAYHYLVAMALVVLGLQYEEGLAFATIVHAAQSLMLMIVGIIGFIGLSQKTKATNG